MIWRRNSPIEASSSPKPVLKIDADRTKRWSVDGHLHREDGPAAEWPDGTKYWYRHGRLHREDGPAVEYSGGTREWWFDGRRHREDGPAAEWPDGAEAWFLHGPAVENSRTGLSLWFLHGRPYAKPVWLREVLKERPLTTHQRELLEALSENWEGTPDSLYETVTNLAK